MRKIECVDGLGGLSTSCEVTAKPVTTQECSTGISCSSEQQVEQASSEVRKVLSKCICCLGRDATIV